MILISKIKKINKFLDELESLPFFGFTALKSIREFAMLNIDRKPLKDAIGRVPSLKKEESEHSKRKEQIYVRQKDACLSKKDAKLFYKIYFGLLEFTNNKYKINKNLRIYNRVGINPYELKDIIEKFWDNKDVIVLEFCMANPYKFNKEELSITNELKKGFRSIVIITKFEAEYTAIMTGDKAYMLKGINDNIDNIISYKKLPQPVMTLIIPFRNKLIYDGILLEIDIKMGVSFERKVEAEYEKAIKYYHL